MGLKLVRKEMSKTANFDEEILSTMSDIETSCDVAIQTLSSLLDYEKLESGIMTLDKKEVLAWPIIKQTVGPFQVQVRRNNIYMYIYIYIPIDAEPSYVFIYLFYNSYFICNIITFILITILLFLFPFPSLSVYILSYQANQAGVKLIICNESKTETVLRGIMILADRHKLSQVFRNLISNAIKFTPEGGTVTVYASVTTSPKLSQVDNYKRLDKGNGSFLHIEVTDAGYGIAKVSMIKCMDMLRAFILLTNCD